MAISQIFSVNGPSPYSFLYSTFSFFIPIIPSSSFNPLHINCVPSPLS